MDNEKKSMYEPGVILGGCTLRRQLNDSGEAMVFLAESGNEEKKEVIIKFFKCGYGEDEIKYLDVLTNHEQRRNIVEMLKSFETPEIRLGMVFKRYETDLFGILGDRQRLQPSTIQKYMKGLMEGLQFIHRMDYIHRDIKPENLLIDGETICIADFGETVLSTSDKVVKPGTLPYLTIEHILGYKENTKSMDIWAAACVLGAMFQGSHLFSQNSNLQTIHAIRLLLGNHTKETWPEMDKLPLMQSIELPPVGEKTFSKIENITKEAADLMEQMMKYDPTKRLMASQVLNHEYFKKEMTRTKSRFTITRDIGEYAAEREQLKRSKICEEKVPAEDTATKIPTSECLEPIEQPPKKMIRISPTPPVKDLVPSSFSHIIPKIEEPASDSQTPSLDSMLESNVNQWNNSFIGSSFLDQLQSSSSMTSTPAVNTSTITKTPIKRQNGAFQCHMCGAMIKAYHLDYYKRSNHAIIHTSLQRYICPVKNCGTKNRHRSNMVVHARTVHGLQGKVDVKNCLLPHEDEELKMTVLTCFPEMEQTIQNMQKREQKQNDQEDAGVESDEDLGDSS